MTGLASLLESLNTLDCEDKGREVLCATRDAIRIGDLAYFHLQHHHFLARVPHVAHTLPRGWGRRLLAGGHRGLGALIRLGLKRVTPLDLGAAPDDEARAALAMPGLRRQAVMVPVHGPGGDTGILLATDDAGARAWVRRLPEILPQLQLFATHFHETFALMSGIVRCEPEELLSRRELECLHWCAQGKSYWETAVILGIAERTVNHYMRMVRDKLQVQTNAQAVSRAHELGLVIPEEFMEQGVPAWSPQEAGGRGR